MTVAKFIRFQDVTDLLPPLQPDDAAFSAQFPSQYPENQRNVFARDSGGTG
jgi:hypothetical protein